MVLVIDCFKLVKGAGKSIGIYNLALNLVRNLVLQPEAHTGRIVVLGNSYNQQDFDIQGVEFICIHHNPLNKLRCVWWELFEVSLVAKKYKADKLLHPRGYAPMLKLTREYIIVHDMIPFYYDEHYKGYFNRLENFYIMWRLKASIRSSSKVITISQASRDDILNRTGVPADKIKVIYNGYNKIEHLPEQVYTPKEYMLAMTSSLPHKNAQGIINAYKAYWRKGDNPLKLKIIGIADVEAYQLPEDIKADIECYKYIESDEQMHQMIAEATIFLFLSLIEGFGFPPIEAMQLGTPVICSSLSSLPEVVGDAAILVKPTDAQAVGDAIEQLQNDTLLQQTLIERGFQNVERFSWKITGEQYAQQLFQKLK